MRYLLDTHTVLWFAENSTHLSETAKKLILDLNHEKYVSLVSAWEVALKISKKKLKLDGGVREFFHIIDDNGFIVLPLKKEHIEIVSKLPFIHSDPFDRLFIASVIFDRMIFITADENIHAYNIDCAW